MKIKNFKKKCLAGSLILLLVGSVIAGTGFAMTGFSPSSFEEANGHRWYQTIYVDNGELAYGIQISEDTNILKIGGNPFNAGLYINY